MPPSRVPIRLSPAPTIPTTSNTISRLHHHAAILSTSQRPIRTMSSSSSSTKPVPRAPWRDNFLSHVNAMPTPEFVLSTLTHEPPSTTYLSNTTGSSSNNNSSSSSGVFPRARFCIFRGLWTHLQRDKRNAATPNPADVVESDCLTFTTDARMLKVHELGAPAARVPSASSDGHKDDGSGSGGSVRASDVDGSAGGDETGGGAPVEAVFWIKEEGVGTQWRVRGDAWVLGRDVEETEKEEVKRVREAVGGWMRTRDGAEEKEREEWSWEREVTDHFGNLGPGMRGSFANPPPGVPTTLTSEDSSHEVGAPTNDLDDPVARANFRVVVIRPWAVESCDLSDPKTARRRFWAYDAGRGEWTAEELWP